MYNGLREKTDSIENGKKGKKIKTIENKNNFNK